MTFARQAIGKKSCGAADVASSMPAPNSSNRSAENRSCQKLKFNPFIISVDFLFFFWTTNSDLRVVHCNIRLICAQLFRLERKLISQVQII